MINGGHALARFSNTAFQNLRLSYPHVIFANYVFSESLARSFYSSPSKAKPAMAASTLRIRNKGERNIPKNAYISYRGNKQ